MVRSGLLDGCALNSNTLFGRFRRASDAADVSGEWPGERVTPKLKSKPVPGNDGQVAR